jgi:hypothetical protein
MGRHDIEDAVDWTISFLTESARAEELDCRSFFHALYAFQSEYDTGFTRFAATPAPSCGGASLSWAS